MKKAFACIMEWKTNACLSFTAAVVIYSVFAWVFHQQVVELRTLLSLLLIWVSILQNTRRGRALLARAGRFKARLLGRGA